MKNIDMNEIIGRSIIREDGIKKVTGTAMYPNDFCFSQQLVLKTVFSPSSHAIIQSIDIEKAQQVPGVLSVLTAQDVPCNEYGLLENDQPVLCGPGSSAAHSDRVRSISDQVALIIAEDEESAQKAAGLIEIKKEQLPALYNARDAIKETSILIHPEKKNNICSHYQIRKGDALTAFKQSHVIIEEIYFTPAQEHAYLQPESGAAFIDEEDRIHVISAGQWAHGDRRQIAHVLNIPEEQIEVEYAAIGGAFGGKEDISVQIILALAVQHLAKRGIRRPVKTTWSRNESIAGHHKRHAFQIHARWGALESGKINAVQMDILADAGAYASSTDVVLKSAVIAAAGPYDIPNIHVDADAVFTNNITAGAFRGFGVPQACFAVEMQMNKLAEALQMDAVEFRLLNAASDSSLSINHTSLPGGVTIREVLHACGDAIKKEHYCITTCQSEISERYAYGTGFAAGFKSFGIPPDECRAKISLHGKDSIEGAVVYHAAADMGQGVHSVIMQIAAQELGIPLERIKLVAGNTRTSKDSGSASASRLTYMAGNAVIKAAAAALKQWASGERPAIGEETYHSPPTTEMDAQNGYGVPNFGFGYAAEAVSIRLDRKTGEIEVLNAICCNDVGKAINPIQVRGQIEGCVIQALGYAMMEEFLQKQGMVLTDSLAAYLLPTIKDIPHTFESIILEIPDPNGPYGARGMGEIPFGPFAPALCAAVHDAAGVWIHSLPLKPEKVLNALESKKNTGNIN